MKNNINKKTILWRNDLNLFLPDKGYNWLLPNFHDTEQPF